MFFDKMKSIVEKKRCCAFCGRELTGRSDKKFCDDTCRNNYAYRQSKDNNVLIDRINKSLLNNRNVLGSMVKRGKKIVKKQALIDNNFNFEVITGVYKTHNRHEYKMLYDYAYRCINDADVLVIKCLKI